MSEDGTTGDDRTGDDAMAAEFDIEAEWAAEAAEALGADHHLPAACRGSGGPPTFDWLTRELGLRDGERLLDVGAGIGGPAAYVADRVGVRPILLEPAAGACRAARRLFDLPVLRADATALPVADASVPAVWSLGVLCTVHEQAALLAELRRVVGDDGRVGLLTFVADRPHPDGEPEGNDFPTDAQLEAALARAGLRVEARVVQGDLGPAPGDWHERDRAVSEEMRRRHGADDAWRSAENERAAVGRLLDQGTVRGVLHVARPA